MMARFVHAIWFGSGIFLVLATQAAFRAASSPTAAATFVGALLGRWHYIALAAPIVLLALEWRRARSAILIIIFAGVVFAAAQVIVDLRIRSIRASSPVPISELSRRDPIRRQFGRLHGVSTLLLLAQITMAGIALGADREAYQASGLRPRASGEALGATAHEEPPRLEHPAEDPDAPPPTRLPPEA